MNKRAIEIKENIWKNYLFMILRIDFTHGFWMIFLFNKGIELVYLGLLETIFHLTSFFMEIPTGIVADVFGRKLSRILGRILFALSNVIILLGTQFHIIALGFVLTAISYNLESGAGEALVYDSLKEIGDEKSYLKVVGRIESIYRITGLISFLVGGAIALINYEWLYYLTIAFSVISIIPALFFVEPQYKKDEYHELKPLDEFRQLIKDSVILIRTNRRLAFFILSMEFILSIGTVLFYYLQNFWKLQGMNELWIGVAFAASSAMGILGGLLAHYFERKMGQKQFLYIFPWITVLSVWMIAFTSWHIMAFIIVTFVDSVIFVGMNDFINREIESHIRATVLSVSSMLFSFYMIILFPIFGYISENFNFHWAFIFLAAISSLVLISNFNLIKKL